MIEPVLGTHCLRCHVTTVIGIDRRIEWHPAGNLNAGRCQAVELGRVVGQQHDPRAVQHPEHMCGDAVVALIIVEAERGVGVEGVEAVILQLICPHLVGEAKSAALLRQI